MATRFCFFGTPGKTLVEDASYLTRPWRWVP